MTNDVVIVVGDAFGEFASGKPVLTISQFEALTQLPVAMLGHPKTLLLGQGVAADRCHSLMERIRLDPVRRTFLDVDDLERAAGRATQAQSHKRHDQNTIIGAPEHVAEATYRLALLVDERCELMGDHQTGQHVQGMVLIEACRQSFLAVTETYYPLPGRPRLYIVINSMDVTFNTFVFPLPGHITYVVEEQDINERRGRFRAKMDVVQNGATCTTCIAAITAYPADFMSGKEAELATRTTETAIRQRAQGAMMVA